MLAEDPRVIIDLMEYLPPPGETDVQCTSVEGDLVLHVRSEVRGRPSAAVDLLFERPCWFHKVWVPGVRMTPVKFDYRFPATAVVQFGQSEAANAWNAHMGSDRFHHYAMDFSAENLFWEVIATTCRVV